MLKSSKLLFSMSYSSVLKECPWNVKSFPILYVRSEQVQPGFPSSEFWQICKLCYLRSDQATPALPEAPGRRLGRHFWAEPPAHLLHGGRGRGSKRGCRDAVGGWIHWWCWKSMTFPSIVIVPFWEGSTYWVPFNHSFTNNNQKKDRAYKKKKASLQIIACQLH